MKFSNSYFENFLLIFILFICLKYSLKFNSIRSEGTQYLASALCVNSGLKVLSLCGNEMCGLDEYGDGDYDPLGIISFTKTLQANNHLRTLKIAENDIGDEGARYLAEALKVNSTLTSLDVHGNSLCTLLENHPVPNHSFGIQSPTGNCSTPIKSNDIIDTNATDYSPVPGGSDITPSPSSSDVSSLTFISPSSDNYTHHPYPNMTYLPSHMNNNNNMNINSITMTGCYCFFDSLASNTTLAFLDLSWNDMGPIAASLLGTALLTNSTLKSLNLAGNPLGDDGIEVFSRGLCNLDDVEKRTKDCYSNNNNNSNTTIDDPSNTSIGNNDGSFLSTESVRSRCGLVALNLETCAIGTEGIKHFANAITYNTRYGIAFYFFIIIIIII